jgi:hypothetical protein
MIIINVYHQRLSLKLPNRTLEYIREYRTKTVQKSTKNFGISENLGKMEFLGKMIYERNKK